MRNLKILYAGSPLPSSIVLKNLIELGSGRGYEIVAVLTNPPSPRGRHKELIPTEVAQVAQEHGIPVLAFDHLLAEAREAVAPLGADLLVSFDYGRIFGEKFLALFPLGGINLHPSALPKYRGCTPVPAAILNGDKTFGIAVQKLALKMDEGDILAQASVPLDGTETTGWLMDGDGTHSTVTDEGTKLIDGVLTAIVATASEDSAAGTNADSRINAGTDAKVDANADGVAKTPFSLPPATPQTGDTSYTPFIKKEDGIIDWKKSAAEIDRQIRAYTPWPLCTTSCNGTNLLIIKAHPATDGAHVTEPAGTVLPYRKAVGIEIACGDGSVLVATELQWQAKKAMDYKSFMNGARNFIGSVLD